MSRRFIIIQARLSSTRLPNKVLLPLCGKSVLEIMLDRLSHYHQDIIIATTDSGDEQPIIDIANRYNIRYYQGSTTNVLERFVKALEHFGSKSGDTVVRLTSDCPLIDSKILRDVIDYYDANDYDYVNNTLIKKFPRGFDCEVFGYNALLQAHQNGTSEYEREHVTTYIYNTHKEEFEIGCFEGAEDNSHYRLTLDEKDDYTAIKEIYKLFNCSINFHYDELIEVLKANPQIAQINSHVEQKKL